MLRWVSDRVKEGLFAGQEVAQSGQPDLKREQGKTACPSSSL